MARRLWIRTQKCDWNPKQLRYSNTNQAIDDRYGNGERHDLCKGNKTDNNNKDTENESLKGGKVMHNMEF